MRNKLVFIILLFFVCTCLADNVVMFIGGTGNQDGNPTFGPYYPGVVKKSVWEAGDVSDFMGTDGAPIYGLHYTEEYPEAVVASNTITIAGDFSNAVVGTYCYLVFLGDDAAYNGYFEITSANSTNLIMGDTNLDGGTLPATADVVDIVIGGAGTSITVADARIAADFGATNQHYVTVLFNKGLTASTATSITTAIGDGSIVYRGVRHADGYEFEDCEDYTQFPVIDTSGGTYGGSFNLTTCSGVRFENTYFESEYFYGLILSSSSAYSGICIYNCIVDNVNANNAIKTYGYDSVVNCVIKTSSNTTTRYALDMGSARCLAYGNFILTNGACGIKSGTTYSSCVGNILCNYGSSDDNIGIEVTGTGYSFVLTDNYVVNFRKGIVIPAFSATGYFYTLINNIIWGDNNASSYGFYTTGTVDNILFKSNFVGNCNTDSNLQDIYETTALSVSPFLNSTGDMNTPSDFYLNGTAGGGALVKANWQPTKYGLGSDRDNWQYGTIMAEPAAGGTTTGGSITVTED